MADGGTVWMDVDDATCSDNTTIPEFVKEHGRFAYLEGIVWQHFHKNKLEMIVICISVTWYPVTLCNDHMY